VTSNYDYDLASRLLTVEHNNGGNLLARYASTLDPNGNRTQTVITGSAVTNHTETAEYDEIDQFTTATYGPGDSVTYIYDDNGNRLAQTSGGVTTNYTYDELDRLTATTGGFASTSSYDDNGNRTSVSYGSGGTDSFSYDWGNRLTSATVGGSPVDYGYSGDDLRVSRTEGGVTESYLWDRLSALPTMVDDGTTQSVHGPTGITNEITGSSASYALPDGLGSVRVWADSSGSATGAIDWDLWGNLRSTTGAVGLHGFTGERADPTTNLVYLRARDYSPGTARFAQPDPIQPNADGTHGYHPYWYANNNPGTFTHPTGTSAGQFTSTTTIRLKYELMAGGWAVYSMMAMETVIAGEGALLLGLGATIGTAFALVALVFLVILLMYTIEMRCHEHGCTLPPFRDGSVFGWVKSTFEAGKGTVAMGIAGAATGACVATLVLPGLAASPAIANQCAPVRNCTSELIEEPFEQAIEAVGGDQIELPNLYANPVGGDNSDRRSSKCDPSPCDKGSNDDDEPKGGIYALVDEAGNVRYVGRTNDLERRRKEHQRRPKFANQEFRVLFRTDSYLEQRGLEQYFYRLLGPDLNKRNPNWSGNPLREVYEVAADRARCRTSRG
jgi:RHS repeat-associated protein